MAQQTINIGAVANDGTGDPLRTAFDKVNDNFTELYADDAGDVNSVNAGTGISVDQTTGVVTVTNSAPNATHTGDVTGATALTIANDVITDAKLGVQYTEGILLGSGQNNLDFSLGQVFTKTISGATTLTFSNAVLGDIKLCYMAGDAPTFPAGYIVGGGAWEVGVTNVVQIAYTGSVYLYSINQLS